MHYVMHAGGKVRRLFGRRRDARDENEDDFDESEEENSPEEEEREPDAHGRIEPSFGPAPIGEEFDDEEVEDDVNAPVFRAPRSRTNPMRPRRPSSCSRRPAPAKGAA